MTQHPLEDVLLDHVDRQADFYDRIVGYPIPDRPTPLSFERGEFRLGFLREELAEAELAISDEDLEGQADAMVDIALVALGGLVEMGICTRAALEEVMAANSRKERGTKSTRPGSAGYDAVKPEGWRAPDYGHLLKLTNAQARLAAHITSPQTFTVEVERRVGELSHTERYIGLSAEQVLGLSGELSRLDARRAAQNPHQPPGHSVEDAFALPPEALDPTAVMGLYTPDPYNNLPVPDVVTLPHIVQAPTAPVADPSGFLKFDQGKTCRPELIPAPVIKALGELYAYGATKYAAENWRLGADYQRYLGAAERHIIDWRLGQDYDPPVSEGGNGCHNLICAAWNLTTLYMLQQLGVGNDDRPDARA